MRLSRAFGSLEIEVSRNGDPAASRVKASASRPPWKSASSLSRDAPISKNLEDARAACGVAPHATEFHIGRSIPM